MSELNYLTEDYLDIEIELKSKLKLLSDLEIVNLIIEHNLNNEFIINSICNWLKMWGYLSKKQRKCLEYCLLNSNLDLFTLL